MARVQRRRAALEAKLAAAETPSDRVAVCADHLRSALKRADPALAASVAADACAALRRLAEFLETQPRNGGTK
ncbi:hypothetical protein GCM10027447_02040 [Glycomyces halotolerans]